MTNIMKFTPFTGFPISPKGVFYNFQGSRNFVNETQKKA